MIGKGKRIYPNGDEYDGDWIHEGELDEYSQRSGQGVYIFEDGTEYQGDWDSDEITGHGQCVHANGDSYEGDWVCGERFGQGTYVFGGKNGQVKAGVKVTGQWKNGKFNSWRKNQKSKSAEYDPLFCGPLKPKHEIDPDVNPSNSDSEEDSFDDFHGIPPPPGCAMQ